MIKLIDPLLPGLSLKAVLTMLTSIGSDYPLYSWSTQKLLDLYVSEVLEERNDTTPIHPPPPKSMDPGPSGLYSYISLNYPFVTNMYMYFKSYLYNCIIAAQNYLVNKHFFFKSYTM